MSGRIFGEEGGPLAAFSPRVMGERMTDVWEANRFPKMSSGSLIETPTNQECFWSGADGAEVFCWSVKQTISESAPHSRVHFFIQAFHSRRLKPSLILLPLLVTDLSSFNPK